MKKYTLSDPLPKLVPRTVVLIDEWTEPALGIFEFHTFTLGVVPDLIGTNLTHIKILGFGVNKVLLKIMTTFTLNYLQKNIFRNNLFMGVEYVYCTSVLKSIIGRGN